MVKFWEFVALRQAAYWRRERGPGPPYSDDPALARYHFCNVYREADRGTLWYQANRTMPHDESDLGVLSHELWQSVSYRLLNRVATFEAYGGLPERGGEERWLNYVAARMAAGERAFTGRHQCRGYSRYYATVCWLRDGGLGQVTEALLDAETLEAACAIVRKIPGCGAFFSWQVLCDLLESGRGGRFEAVRDFPDLHTWVMLGPGAVAGARLVTLLPPSQLSLPDDLIDELTWAADQRTGPRQLNRKECLVVARMLQETQEECLKMADAELVPPPQAPGRMSLKNVEHALCEYARYVRASDPATSAGLEVKPWAR